MKKNIYRRMPDYLVTCYTNTVHDLFDEKRFTHKQRKTIHDHLRPYIRKWIGEDGRILRTKGQPDSKRLAVKIFLRMMQLVKEDMIEENDFFYLPGGDYIGHKTKYIYNPDTLNRHACCFLEQTQRSRKKVGNNYKFVFDNSGLKRLTAKIRVNGNSNCFSKNHHINVGENTQNSGLKRERYRRMVWGMP